jgi:hypothetical protein
VLQDGGPLLEELLEVLGLGGHGFGDVGGHGASRFHLVTIAAIALGGLTGHAIMA